MPIFIDKDTGAEWEEPLDNGVPADPTYKIIRPVKQEPKWHIETDYIDEAGEIVEDLVVAFLPPYLTQDQAQLIKELIEKIMFGLDISNAHYFDDTIRKAFDKARKALEEE